MIEKLYKKGDDDALRPVRTVWVVWYFQSWADSPAAGVKAVFSTQEAAEKFAQQDSDYEVEEVPVDPEGEG